LFVGKKVNKKKVLLLPFSCPRLAHRRGESSLLREAPAVYLSLVRAARKERFREEELEMRFFFGATLKEEEE
jgi:hypothetical protein